MFAFPGRAVVGSFCQDHVSIFPLHKASHYPEIDRTLTEEGYQEITEYALDRGFENAFVQELESQERCLPDFEQEIPFKFDQFMTYPLLCFSKLF